MIKFNFEVMNPWRTEGFDNLFWAGGSFTKHKHWEVEVYTNKDVLVGMELDLQWWGHDHAGFKIRLMLSCLEFNANIYDSRHWNHSTRTWQKYE